MESEKTFNKLHENIYEINNQYFYGSKVHTYLLELKDKVLLFDLPTYTKEVENFILSFDKPAYAILSHGSCGIEDGSKWQEEIGLKVYAHADDEHHPWIRMTPDVLFSEPPTFDPSILVIHTPGHSAGSICLLDLNSKSLFSGDTLYGDDSDQLRDFTLEDQRDYENLQQRIKSCQKLSEYAFDRVYPFHYDIINRDAQKKLSEYLKWIAAN